MIPAKDRQQIEQVVELIDDVCLLLGLRLLQQMPHAPTDMSGMIKHAKKAIADRLEKLGSE